MPTVKVRNLKNEEIADLELSDAVFGVEYNEGLVHAAVKGYLAKARAGTPPTRVLKEFRLEVESGATVGDKILVGETFADGDTIEVIGKSKGRGFAGTVKRHNFSRGPESHGSMNVRAPGSIGQSAYPSRVIKGTRSSGHMGDVRITIKGLTVASVDAENNLLMIRGAVPGANGTVVIVKKSVRQKKK